MRCHYSGLLLTVLLLQLSWFVNVAWAQRSAYSLQAAVNELHRREAEKYPLNAPPQHYFGTSLGAASGEDDYWDDDIEIPTHNKNRNRHRINKALAKYLERENYDADHGGLSLGPFGGYEFDDEENNNNLLAEQKKRASLFRERDIKFDNPPTSVFRERESQVLAGGDAVEQQQQQQQHAELTEQFLREIEEASEHERQERYKDALRHLWEKYQQQENEVNSDLFEEKKRFRVPPYYMLMQKKRSYPVLPWLPYSADKKKRFPVAKRSAKRSPNENMALGKTNDKVARELSELFGKPIEEKAKRSTDTQLKIAGTTNAPDTPATALSDMRLEVGTKHNNDTHEEQKITSAPEVSDHNHAGYHVHATKEHKHRKRSNHAQNSHEHSSEESSAEEAEHEEHEEEEAESDEDDHEDEDDAEERRKKKKRDAAEKTSMLQGLMGARSKKSIDWSSYFGLDRKKKSIPNTNQEAKKSNVNDDDDIEEQQKKKRDLDPEKLESMDKKLQSIEDLIIDETIKYTGAHEGISNQAELHRLKDHVLSRLTTAYSLEKMRRALEKLRQSVENENHLNRNIIEPDSEENGIEYLQNQKRLSVKKEKAELHEIESSAAEAQAKEKNQHLDNEDDDDNGNEMRKKKKRNGYLRYPELPNNFDDELSPGGYESFNDAYLGNKNYIIGSNQCPLIESMAERCRGVDLLSGDINQELLPICGVHQICYLCGTSQVACDYQYLAEADTICGTSNDCQAAARSVLMILRGTPGPQLGPRECLKNPCLYSAMREIGL